MDNLGVSEMRWTPSDGKIIIYLGHDTQKLFEHMPRLKMKTTARAPSVIGSKRPWTKPLAITSPFSLCDFNAKVDKGSADKTNDNGDWLISFCLANALSIGNTYLNHKQIRSRCGNHLLEKRSARLTTSALLNLQVCREAVCGNAQARWLTPL